MKINYYLLGFAVFSLPTKEEAEKSKCDKPLYWSLLITLITLAIIALYAWSD